MKSATIRQTQTELTDGACTSYTYDAASRVQQLYNLKADGSVILGLTYDHDPVGNPTSMLESSGDRVTWTYDATDRLTREQRSGPSGYDTGYTYDPLANRLVKDASGALTTSTYDLGNQLVTSQDAKGVTTYTYDLAGNLHIVEQPTGQRTTTTWDDQNRQTAVLQPTGAITTNTFRFDGLRHSKQEPQSTTKFLWDVNNYLTETNAADEIQAVYTNEPQPYGNLISQYRKDGAIWTPRYFQFDALGSTRILTDDDGEATDVYLYDAWGNQLAVSGSTVNPFRWIGRVGYYWDEATGTFYIRARVYDPVTGRWMSQDPLFYPVSGSSRQPGAIGTGRRLSIENPSEQQHRFNLFRAYFIPESVDPSGLFAGSPDKGSPVGVAVEGKRICGIVLMEANGGPVPDAGLLNTNAIVPERPFSTQEEILNFVQKQKCCTLYLLGHCGSTSGGIVGQSGGIGPIILPDDHFEAQLRQAFLDNGCSHCVINIFACALGDTAKVDATRDGIAKDTGCLTCGTLSGLQQTLWNPLNPCSKEPWRHACKPPKKGWKVGCIEMGVASGPYGPVPYCRRSGWMPLRE
ncbi:MAG: hypothetical protein KJ000_10010 [Pirellulaceae bacterium]|nr:hypothetical protein [Pirellulaceae bacterium]